MKRLHVHVSVENIPDAIGFYSALFAAQPSVVKTDYAKWMLDDPRVNFAISMRGRAAGLDHLGIQVEDQAELHEVYARLGRAGGAVIEQGATTCCYAKSEKSWIDDPAGISWETFLTTGESTIYGDGSGERSSEARIAQMPNAKDSSAKASSAKASNAKASNAKPRNAETGACCAPQPAAAKASACCNS